TENVVNTVRLDADTIIILNVEDDVIISAREILFYGGKLTYDSVIELKQGGSIRFFENFSIQGLSGDAIIKLENGKEIRLFDVKTKKIRDLADEFVPDRDNYGKDATMVGHGFTITYNMLDNLSKKPTKKQKSGWASKFGFSKK
ncbi:MAG: molecular chaperone DnaJ, partial [Nitrosopumilus sp.]|nr:molecular chaperone DnaJ [Nitrosopumilus sp.]